MSSAHPATTPRKLSLRRVLVGAFALPWQYRLDVIRNAGVPLLLVTAITVAWGLINPGVAAGQWSFWLIFALLNCWLAVTVHRMVLVDHPGSALRFDRIAIRRLATFAAVSLGYWVVYSGARLWLFSGTLLLLGSQYVPAGATPRELPVPMATIDHVTFALAFVVIGRLALLLPAIAAGERLDVVDVWRRSAGNSWRMAVVIGLLPWLLGILTSLLGRDGATFFEWVAVQLIVSVTVIFEVVALSLAYRDLMVPAPPPTDPPA